MKKEFNSKGMQKNLVELMKEGGDKAHFFISERGCQRIELEDKDGHIFHELECLTPPEKGKENDYDDISFNILYALFNPEKLEKFMIKPKKQDIRLRLRPKYQPKKKGYKKKKSI